MPDKNNNTYIGFDERLDRSPKLSRNNTQYPFDVLDFIEAAGDGNIKRMQELLAKDITADGDEAGKSDGDRLKKKQSPLVRGNWGISAMSAAIEGGQVKSLELLLKHNPQLIESDDVYRGLQTLIGKANMPPPEGKASIQTIELLLKTNPDLAKDDDIRKVFQDALNGNAPDELKALIKQYAPDLKKAPLSRNVLNAAQEVGLAALGVSDGVDASLPGAGNIPAGPGRPRQM